MSELQLLTNSRSNCFGECHRKHYYRYELGAKPITEAENLRFGTLVHACLELWWRNHKGIEDQETGNIIGRMQTVYAYLEERRLAGDDPFELAKARAMMDGYEAMWWGVACETVSVEQEFRAPMMNPDTNGISRTWELAGKMDVVAIVDGMLQVVEHKTTAFDIAPDAKYWTKLAIDGQVSQYYIGGQALGYDIRGTVYDVLRKPGLRPSQIPLVEDGAKVVHDAEGNRVRTKDGKKWRETGDTAMGYVLQTRPETVEEYEERLSADIQANLEKYFRRLPVPRTDADLVEFLGDKWSIGREIADAQKANRWPKNPRSCDNFGTCEFFEVCAGRESIDNPHVFKRGDIHAELVTATMETF